MQTDADPQLDLRRLSATAGHLRVSARRAARRLDPPKTGGRPSVERPALGRLIGHLAGIFESATDQRPAAARNRDDPDYRGGPFERFVMRVLEGADADLGTHPPTRLVGDVCRLWPDLPERCWLILGRRGMGPAGRIQSLRRAVDMYQRGRLGKRDKECRDELRAVLYSNCDDQAKIETIGEFIAQTVDIEEAVRRDHELSSILGTGPVIVEIVGIVSRQ